MIFGKLLTAMVTPFDERLEIDYERTREMVEHLIATGTDTIVVAGTTGESPTLNQTEKLMLFETVKKQADGRAKVIANAGSNDTRDSIEFVKEIDKLQVADGIMLVNPYYNKPSQEGLYQHFKAVAEATTLPVMLYNIPGRTGVNLQAETAIRLAQIPNINALKESSGDLSQMAKIVEGTTEDFIVYAGDDNLTLPALSIGAKGVVSVAAHIVGPEIKEMIEAYERGDGLKAARIHRNLLSFFEGIFFTTNPVPIKAICNKIGLQVGSVRLPLVPLSEEEEIRVKELIQWSKNKKTT